MHNCQQPQLRAYIGVYQQARTVTNTRELAADKEHIVKSEDGQVLVSNQAHREALAVLAKTIVSNWPRSLGARDPLEWELDFILVYKPMLLRTSLFTRVTNAPREITGYSPPPLLTFSPFSLSFPSLLSSSPLPLLFIYFLFIFIYLLKF